MNFRVCKKYCRMKNLKAVAYCDECIGNRQTCNYVVFDMNGDNCHCSFSVDGYDFVKQFMPKMEKAISEHKVTYEDGHEGDPAFSTKRHIPLLEEIDMDGVTNLFDTKCNLIKKCPHCEKHKDNFVELVEK